MASTTSGKQRPRRLVASFALAIVGLMLTAAFTAGAARASFDTTNAVSPPSIASDKADYAPGELVTLSGTGWQPAESVHIFVNDDAGQTWSHSADVTAAADGTISDQFVLPDWLVATYSVTATGTVSGTASTSFTDAKTWTLTISPTSTRVSKTATYTLTATNTTTGSGNRLGCVGVTIPSQFTPVAGSAAIVSVSASHAWTIAQSGATVTGKASTSADRLNNSESFVFTVAATSPTTTTGSPFTWTGVADGNQSSACANGDFNAPTSPPTVSAGANNPPPAPSCSQPSHR